MANITSAGCRQQPPMKPRSYFLALLGELHNVHGHTDAEITAELLQKGVDVIRAKDWLKHSLSGTGYLSAGHPKTTPTKPKTINPNIKLQLDD